MRVTTAALAALLAVGCNGGGGMTGSAKAPKDDSKQKPVMVAPVLPTPASPPDPSGADDNADQPVQISGTYLTCATLSTAAAGEGEYGCRLAAQGKTKVPLDQLSPPAAWMFRAPVGTGAGAISVSTEASTSAWHVIYHLKSPDALSLKNLLASLTVILAIPPAAALKLDQYSFERPMPEILDAGSAQGDLANAATSIPVPAPAVAPPAIVPSGGSSAEPAGPPSVRFALAGNGPRYSLQAALTSAAGVTGFAFTTPAAIAALRTSATVVSGGARLAWSLPVSVAFQYGGKSCRGTAAVGPGTMTLTPVCN